ncbi:MAG: hypothetical protein ACKODM_16590 [Cytophagales bacterium]
MMKPILYHSIEEKNLLEREMSKALSPKEALIKALDIIDLYVQLRKLSGNTSRETDDIHWIILSPKK